MSKQPYLYDAQNIDTVDWKSIPSENVKSYLSQLIKTGISPYIANVHSDLYLIKLEDIILPVVVPRVGATNSYVCSPYGHYILYAADNLHAVKSDYLRKVVDKAFKLFGGWLKRGSIDSVVYVNHHLLSIDLYPKGMTQERQEIITDFLTKRFPDRAIIFRSVNSVAYPNMGSNLQKIGYHLFPTRHIYLADTSAEELFKRRIIKSDVKLYNEMPYRIVKEDELKEKEIERMCKLYHSVYIEGHSTLNPQITPEYIDLLIKNRVLEFRVLKDKEEEIKGFVGFQECGGVLLCPLFGYDKADSEHSELYRLLNTVLLLEARKKGLLFNAAAGASFFKKIRYPSTCMENKAVYYKHLPLKARLRWGVLKAYANKIAAHFMKKY